MNFLNWMATQGFLPHGYCFQWSPTLLTTMVAADAITAVAYYSIPLAILVFIDRHRKNTQFSWVFMLFAFFIFACGTTHVVDIITIWYPAYWMQAWVKVATAAASILTAILIWPIALKATEVIDGPATKRVKELEEEVAELKLQLAARNG